MASRVRGITKLRRTLRRMEPEIRGEVQGAIADAAEAIKQDARSLVPKAEGDLARSIEVVFSSDKLAAVIGPGAKGARVQKRAASAKRKGREVRLSTRSRDLLFQLSKGRWLEFGTKGSPEHGIQPLATHPFMGPAFNLNERYAVDLVRKAVNRALRRVTKT